MSEQVNSSELSDHFFRVARWIRTGYVVPFLGAGVNLTDGPAPSQPPPDWSAPQARLPNGSELAEWLATTFHYPTNDLTDLSRVAQYASVMEGPKELYRTLRRLFNTDHQPTTLHALLAYLPQVVRISKGDTFPLIITTNYDDLLETSFNLAGETFDLLTYIADGTNSGKFVHTSPNGKSRVIHTPNKYTEVSLENHSVIVKIHGSVDRHRDNADSYVVTEDQYISYLSTTRADAFLPINLKDKLQDSHLLFLGYSLSDWNMRVILHRMWAAQDLTQTHFAVQKDPKDIDRRIWAKRDVTILDVPLDAYAAGLRSELQSLEVR